MNTSAPPLISIGIDLGHSSVKSVIKCTNRFNLTNATEIFPTVVRAWTPIANAETARRAEADTVTVNLRKFFVGKTAQLQGQADSFSGQSRNWIETEQHDALLMSAWNRAQAAIAKNGLERISRTALVLGLPASYYGEQRDILQKRANALLRPLVAPGCDLQIYIESQSRAPLLCVVFDSNGEETGRGGEDESWAVVELGQFTTDFTLHDRGQEVDSAASSARGVSMVYERVANHFKQKGIESDFETIQKAIMTKKIKDFGREVDVSDIVGPAIHEFTTYILDEVSTRFGSKARRLDGLIVAGGGAYIVGSEIKAKYPNAIVPANARFAVAEGYSRFGLLTLY
jgi:plasmid segregation protein ParM